jgi:hypothetical protein
MMTNMPTLFVSLAFVATHFLSTANAQCTPCASGEPLCDDSQLVSVAGFAATDSSCKSAQLANFQKRCCNGPPYDFCTICPDGSTPPGLDNGIPTGEFATDPTCNEFQYQPNSRTNLIPGQEGNCADTFLQRTSHYCGCPQTQQECFLCPDGSTPGNPDRGEAWATNANCRGLEFLFSAFTAEECPIYPNNFGVNFAAFCMCPGVEEPPVDNPECSICNGNAVVNPDFVYAKPPEAVFERKCSQAEEFAKYITNSKSCDALLQKARIACCPDGSIPGLQTNTEGASGGFVRYGSGATGMVVTLGVTLMGVLVL